MTAIKDRISAALAGGPLGYHALMHAVFPRDQFPRAMRSPTKGGPPGCAFAFGRALREMGIFYATRSDERGYIIKPPALAGKEAE